MRALFIFLSVSAVNLFSVCDFCDSVVQVFRKRAENNKTPENVKSLRDTPFFQLLKMCGGNEIVENKALTGGNYTIPNSHERKIILSAMVLMQLGPLWILTGPSDV